MNYPKEIDKIKDIYKNECFKTYIVGGAVRDFLVGIEVDDYDIATDATLEDGLRILKEAGIEAIPTGESFPVLRAKINGLEFEIATFRSDAGNGKNTSYSYSSIHDDASRRDFSINALYYNLETGEIIDFFEGQNDIKDKILRFVGDPKSRITEDRLRIVRAIRLSEKLKFFIENRSAKALYLNNRLFDQDLPEDERISRERMIDEMKKAHAQTDFFSYIQRLDIYGILNQIFEGLDCFRSDAMAYQYYEMGSMSEHFASFLQLYDLINKEKYIIEELKWSRDLYNEVLFLLKYERCSLDIRSNNVYNFNQVYKLYKKLNNASFSLENWVKNRNLCPYFLDAFLKYKPAINGKDLIDKGFVGEHISKEKERLENEHFFNLYHELKTDK
jgi:tRNA nucleotidyltransferase/poly(A) polymerase